ncbi:hypothetical protein FRB94_012811 [Tulasnella sp. JGI-2019a]|nr:hypothetical protein FRB94_012811 [Tulasnella sp. JGI-2019a]KAG9016418.1 hypothetical protein FRB93_010667 [Tulasnella sp. JGI-2019a]
MPRVTGPKFKKRTKRSRHINHLIDSDPGNSLDGDDDTRNEEHTAELERLQSQLLAQKDRNFKLSESTQRLNRAAQKAQSQQRNEIAQNQLLQAKLDKTTTDLMAERLSSQNTREIMKILAADGSDAIIRQLQRQIQEEETLRLAAEAEVDRGKQRIARMNQLDETVTALSREKAQLAEALMPLKRIAPQVDFTIPANLESILAKLILEFQDQRQSFQVEKAKRLEAEAERNREKLAARATGEQNNSLGEELKKVRARAQERDELIKSDAKRCNELELRLKQLEMERKGREEEHRRSDAAIKHLQEKVNAALTKEFDTEEQNQNLKKALEEAEEKYQGIKKEQDRARRDRERLRQEASDSRQAFLKMELERNETRDRLRVVTDKWNVVKNAVTVKMEMAD